MDGSKCLRKQHLIINQTVIIVLSTPILFIQTASKRVQYWVTHYCFIFTKNTQI
jgi:hypothetical protein